MRPIIEIKNLSFAYEKEKNVLEDISVLFNENRIIAIIGKNGSGKSTFLDCLLGINDYQGNILLNNQNIRDFSSKEYAKQVSYINQNTQINIDYSVRDFISFGRNPHLKIGIQLNESDYKKIDNNAIKCGIEHILDKDINKISGGERQLAFIARALTQETPIIVMDEPTAALDFGNQQKLFKIMQQLVKEGKTIIFTTHNPNHLINLDCDIYAFINNNLIEIKELNETVIKDIYGEEFKKEGKTFIFKL